MFFLVVMSISGIYALANQSTNGALVTGIVDIEIQTFKLDNGQETKYNDTNKTVIPGETVSIRPKVCNLAENCYVRVKVDYIDQNTNFLDYVTGFSDELEKHGEYYYYNRVLNTGETLKIFDTIKIPNNITKTSNNKTLKLEIVAQAIQEKNFEPDYTAGDPWKNVAPTECINSSFIINENKSKISIRYEDNTNNDVTVNNNFFEKMAASMPGDSFKDSVEIKNNNKYNTRYYLSIDTNGKIPEEKNLLNNVDITITNKDGKVIYKGKLLDINKTLLGEYTPNEYDKLNFTVSIPDGLGNEFAKLNPDISFVFSSENDNKNNNETTPSNPQTGDKIEWAITIFLTSSIGLIVVMILGYREKQKKNIDSIN